MNNLFQTKKQEDEISEQNEDVSLLMAFCHPPAGGTVQYKY
jgi:hypothetical protein